MTFERAETFWRSYSKLGAIEHHRVVFSSAGQSRRSRARLRHGMVFMSI